MRVLPISEFCKTGSGGTPSRSKQSEYYAGGTIPWVKSGELSESVVDSAEEFITEKGLVESSAKLLQPGAVLIAMYGATVGQVSRLAIPAATNQAICHIYPDEKVCSPDYIYRVLKGAKDRLLAKRVGGGQPNISQKIVRALPIPLPPLAEQKRIAGILDAADALRAKRRESLAQLDTLLHSTFLNMFGDPITNPMGWEKVAVADLCESSDDVRCGPFGTQLHQHEFTDAGVPLWGIKHVNVGFAFPTDEFVSDTKAASLAQYSIIPGDLVMTRKGTIGNCHIYPSSLEPGIMHSDLLRLRISPARANVQFVCSQFAYSRHIQRQLELMSPGAVMPGINVTKLKKLEVEAPPLDLQHRFAAIVESVEQQRACQRAHLTELDNFFASLQSRAFRGDL